MAHLLGLLLLPFFLLFCVAPRAAALVADAASLLPLNEGTSTATARLAALTPSWHS